MHTRECRCRAGAMLNPYGPSLRDRFTARNAEADTRDETRGLIEFLLSRQSFSAALQVALKVADHSSSSRPCSPTEAGSPPPACLRGERIAYAAVLVVEVQRHLCVLHLCST